MWSLVTVMHNYGIQLFCVTVKYCSSHQEYEDNEHELDELVSQSP